MGHIIRLLRRETGAPSPDAVSHENLELEPMAANACQIAVIGAGFSGVS